jgi:hypothetical protein
MIIYQIWDRPVGSPSKLYVTEFTELVLDGNRTHVPVSTTLDETLPLLVAQTKSQGDGHRHPEPQARSASPVSDSSNALVSHVWDHSYDNMTVQMCRMAAV